MPEDTQEYEGTRRKLIALLTAANEDDLSLFIELISELWSSPQSVEDVLVAALFLSLGMLDEIEDYTGTSAQEYIQSLALMNTENS